MKPDNIVDAKTLGWFIAHHPLLLVQHERRAPERPADPPHGPCGCRVQGAVYEDWHSRDPDTPPPARRWRTLRLERVEKHPGDGVQPPRVVAVASALPWTDAALLGACDQLQRKKSPDVPVLLCAREPPRVLRPLLDRCAQLRFVLRPAYPDTREAAELAAAHPNVRLDLGAPGLSRAAVKAVLKRAMEMAPAGRLLWSAEACGVGGCAANAHVREVLAEVLLKRVRRGVMTFAEAGEMAAGVLFDNTNRVYNLGQTPEWGSVQYSVPAGVGGPAPESTAAELDEAIAKLLPAAGVDFAENGFLRFQWVDYTNTLRQRILPLSSYRSLSAQNPTCSLRLPTAILSILHDDTHTPDLPVAGMLRLAPAPSSLRLLTPNHATLMCSLTTDDHLPHALCPRSALATALAASPALLIGFETEIVFLPLTAAPTPHPPHHAYGTATALTPALTALCDAISHALAAAGIVLSAYHAESGPSQFEFVTGPRPPLDAVDALYHTRLTIVSVAAAHGFRATLHPKPFARTAGSAAHVHFSLPHAAPVVQEAFAAGVLRRLRELAAVGMASVASYDRVNHQGSWCGGRYAVWGEEHRETPLRRVVEGAGRWEVRCVDGTANMYLVLAVLVRAGAEGVREGRRLGKACPPVDLGELGSPGVKALVGKVGMLPGSLEEAVERLEGWLGEGGEAVEALAEVLRKYCVVKRAEIEMMRGMEGEERWKWEVARY